MVVRRLPSAALAAALATAATPAAGQSKVAQIRPIVIGASQQTDPPVGSGAALYPSAARKAGVEARVVLRCVLQPEGRFTDCEAMEEEPRGQGFADAALKAATFVRQPPTAGQSGSVVKRQAIMPVIFTLEEEERRVVDSKDIAWAKRPSGADFASLFPETAQRSNVEGSALTSCRIAAEGKLADCRTLVESPYGWGFGQAARELTTMFRAKSRKDGGAIPADAVVRIPIVFRLPKG